ncbi:TIGR04283 family arsenosugar biosynthesis glycosyltransferase [Psychroflexus aurantiacus]|nr:TIGR04283 family arsenosugar biosynthesis glycosyltransferase [Psychroflexus aurantiacus]
MSIIIPVYNEEASIAEVLEHCLKLKGHFEIIVVDGGSQDLTLEKAKRFETISLFKTSKGRARQMNFGAQQARGDILLFLHADTFLPEDAYASILELCKHPEVIGGSFRLIMKDSHPIFKFYKWCSQFSLEFFTYGDHGIFVKTKIFKAINGYKNIDFMEDVEIQKRLRKQGKFKKLKTSVITSNRRFQKNGIYRQLATDVILVVLFKLGISPHRLKQYYPDH